MLITIPHSASYNSYYIWFQSKQAQSHWHLYIMPKGGFWDLMLISTLNKMSSHTLNWCLCQKTRTPVTFFLLYLALLTLSPFIPYHYTPIHDPVNLLFPFLSMSTTASSLTLEIPSFFHFWAFLSIYFHFRKFPLFFQNLFVIFWVC